MGLCIFHQHQGKKIKTCFTSRPSRFFLNLILIYYLLVFYCYHKNKKEYNKKQHHYSALCSHSKTHEAGADDTGFRLKKKMGDEKDQDKESAVVVMDTPERTQIATPLSKFEVNWVFVCAIWFFASVTGKVLCLWFVLVNRCGDFAILVGFGFGCSWVSPISSILRLFHSIDLRSSLIIDFLLFGGISPFFGEVNSMNLVFIFCLMYVLLWGNQLPFRFDILVGLISASLALINSVGFYGRLTNPSTDLFLLLLLEN